MNVWLWGPSLWSVVHGCSQAYDLDDRLGKPIHSLLQTLRVILPCVYCRNSYNGFLDDLGLPKQKTSLEWSQKLHNMVNTKLELQRIDKLRDAECLGLSKDNQLWDNLKSTACRNLLQNTPSLEILTKRCILKIDNPWSEYDLLLILTTLFSHAQGPIVKIGKSQADTGSSATAATKEVLHAQLEFVKALHDIAKIMGAPIDLIHLLQKVLKTPGIDARLTLVARHLFPGHSDEDISQRVRLLRAGACLNGTCV